MKRKITFQQLAEISTSRWNEILQLRSIVFVEEQQCVYLDPDASDETATHLMCAENDRLVAYLRIISNDAWHIGRVVVPVAKRGRSLGAEIVSESIQYCLKLDPEKEIVMSAQVYLTDFYGTLGFHPRGSMYLEDGIPHLELVYHQSLI